MSLNILHHSTPELHTALKTMVIYLCNCSHSVDKFLCNCWHRELSGHILGLVLHVLGRLVDAAHHVVQLL